jgi:hypothetical protein
MNTHFLRGRLLINQGRFDLAIEELRKATALDQDDSPATPCWDWHYCAPDAVQEAVKSLNGVRMNIDYQCQP